MDRRHFLRFSGALCAAQAALPLAARAEQAPVSADWRGFELTTHIQVRDPGAHPRLWIPLPYATDTGYQRGAQSAWLVSGGGAAQLVQAPGYDVRMLAVQWPDAQAPREVTVTSRFQTRNRRVDLTQPPPARRAKAPPRCANSSSRPRCCPPTASSRPPPTASPRVTTAAGAGPGDL